MPTVLSMIIVGPRTCSKHWLTEMCTWLAAAYMTHAGGQDRVGRGELIGKMKFWKINCSLRAYLDQPAVVAGIVALLFGIKYTASGKSDISKLKAYCAALVCMCACGLESSMPLQSYAFGGMVAKC